MDWIKIKGSQQIEEIVQQSFEHPVFIFKHSTRCSTSSVVLNRLERNWKNLSPDQKLSPFFLDLISYREISNQISLYFKVPHESPQVLIVREGKVLADLSHFEIQLDRILDVCRV